jgi:hypothetical protein
MVRNNHDQKRRQSVRLRYGGLESEAMLKHAVDAVWQPIDGAIPIARDRVPARAPRPTSRRKARIEDGQNRPKPWPITPHNITVEVVFRKHRRGQPTHPLIKIRPLQNSGRSAEPRANPLTARPRQLRDQSTRPRRVRLARAVRVGKCTTTESSMSRTGSCRSNQPAAYRKSRSVCGSRRRRWSRPGTLVKIWSMYVPSYAWWTFRKYSAN